MSNREDLKARWYFGGVSSSAAVCFTHPLDLIKVHLQTQNATNAKIYTSIGNIAKSQGFSAFFNGLSASILRQMTYSMTRFAAYDLLKQKQMDYQRSNNATTPHFSFYQKLVTSAFSGVCGGFVGSPADLVNVRMQNDVKLALKDRRCYKNVFDGILKVMKEEGISKLWSGSSFAATRAMFMTIGQIGFYDQIKSQLLSHPDYFQNTVTTHIFASSISALIAVTITQPVDVLKTRKMNSKPNEFKGLIHCAAVTYKEGASVFFKGYSPACIRLIPHTVLTFVFYEQLKLCFGY